MTTPPTAVEGVRCGDLYWIAPDETRALVPHPHVVIQEDVFNRSRLTTVIVCALTTNRTRATEPGNVLLDEDEGGLAKRSIAVVSQVSSVETARLGAKIGALGRARVDEILDGMRFQQASFLLGR